MAIASKRVIRATGCLVSAVVLLFSSVCRSGLAVVLNPPEAVLAGAGCRLGAAGLWNDAGALLELPVGTHVLTFRALDGWITPPPWTVTVESPDRLGTILATYSKAPLPEAQFHLVLDVTGAVSGRRHPLTLAAADQADDAYHPAEDIGVYLPGAEGWSALALTAPGADAGLLWDTRALRPETTWTITGAVTAADPLVLAWRATDLSDDVEVVMTGAVLPEPVDMSVTTSCSLTSPGFFRIQIQARQARLRSMTYLLEAGWNAVGIVHQLLDTSARRLADLQPRSLDGAAGAFSAGHTVPPGRACWVFTPTRTRLELLGMDKDDDGPSAPETRSGWSFETVAGTTLSNAAGQAWEWQRRRFVRATDALTPGVGYWIYRP